MLSQKRNWVLDRAGKIARRTQAGGCQELGEGRMGSECLMDAGVPFGVMKIF